MEFDPRIPGSSSGKFCGAELISRAVHPPSQSCGVGVDKGVEICVDAISRYEDQISRNPDIPIPLRGYQMPHTVPPIHCSDPYVTDDSVRFHAHLLSV